MINMKLDKSFIEKELCDFPYTITVRDCVTSTNSILKEEAKCGKEEYSVLIASTQTEGRGRMGRSFFSPDNSGLYMSVLLRPNGVINPVHITTDAAVAVATAIERVSGKTTGIKWVNDIYIDGRKVCGILAESSLGENSFVIMGIGINVSPPESGFPDDIKMRAGSIFEEKEEYLREKIAVEILKELYFVKSDADTLNEYRSRSIIIGKEIDIIKNDTAERGVALEIDNDYSLVVKKEDGSIEKLSSGDVSIRV